MCTNNIVLWNGAVLVRVGWARAHYTKRPSRTRLALVIGDRFKLKTFVYAFYVFTFIREKLIVGYSSTRHVG